ncbi:site-specific integrase [Hymenobacter artigasi]|uniref:Integrase n=1 Tax=Hymenobacter artigasi TaxID=2719616 RepID=A0ABX1HHD7_9BACT|nr:site-specific integrase [Hymenobacter artigasi]NKI89475.1 integrase [Hymenobacter artigasi]
MPEAKFVLKEPGASGSTLIYLFYNFNQQRLKMSTKLSIPPAQWLPEKQRAVAGKKYPHNADLNLRLNQIHAGVNQAFLRLQTLDEPITPETLKAELEIELGAERLSARPIMLADFAERLTEELAGSRAANTLQVYRSSIQHLRDFEKHSRRRYDFTAINLEFYNKFTDYLSTKKGHTPNTVGKIIKTLKSFLTEAVERKLHTNLDYKSKRFKVEKEETEAIYLTVPELTTLAHLELSVGSSLANVRDIFVFGAFTGLRFSDLAQLSKVAVSGKEGQKVLKVRTQKTDKVVVIPLHPLAELILSRNEGYPPRAYSNPATNRLLKELAQKAGFTDPVEVSTATGKAVKQKWELVTTHTARRSFCTNAYLANIPLPAIMALSGHSKTQTFMSYIRITAEENATQLLTHAFFRNTPAG